MKPPWAKSPGSSRRWFLGANHIGDYMHRWFFQCPWFTIRLHHILRSDESRALHDHPWNFWSFLLTGGYTEVTSPYPAHGPFTHRWWPRWSIVRKKAGDAHRLIIDRPVWTIVVTGPAIRKWGFYTRERGWIYWRDAQKEWQ